MPAPFHLIGGTGETGPPSIDAYLGVAVLFARNAHNLGNAVLRVRVVVLELFPGRRFKLEVRRQVGALVQSGVGRGRSSVGVSDAVDVLGGHTRDVTSVA